MIISLTFLIFMTMLFEYLKESIMEMVVPHTVCFECYTSTLVPPRWRILTLESWWILYLAS